ncbi:MAG: ABC transporter ATP-binding protein [Micrococcaceae bacterium]
MSTIISAKDIKKNFGEAKVLKGISLEIEQGEVLAVMGPSGSGKTTLLHALAAIIDIDSGAVDFAGQDISKLNDEQRTILRRTAFGFVFQFSQLVPELTVLDNVALPLLLNGERRKNAYKQAKKWLDEVGLDDKYDSLPSEISGGQAQRVAIARAMVVQPKILFADEPTGSLDSLSSENVMELFINMVKEHGTTVVMVTHEPSIAAYADREIIVRDGMLSGVSQYAY